MREAGARATSFVFGERKNDFVVRVTYFDLHLFREWPAVRVVRPAKAPQPVARDVVLP